MTSRKISILFLFAILVINGCATYYMKNIKFQEAIYAGDMPKASKLLDDQKKEAEGRNKILYYFNRGFVSYMMKNWDESNKHFQTADLLIEDQQKNYGLEAASFLTNPNVTPYKPEDFEVVMLNYFTALNYLNLGKNQESIVECRRMTIKLDALNDKYKDNKNRYQRDAFGNTLMGLIYDANRDYNNAFIAYRNALEIYETDYKKNFEVTTPQQLKQDILRTAYLTGFYDEVAYYEKKFGLKYEHKPNQGGQLIFFWLNGFGPVKDEWSINFTQTPGKDGVIMFANAELGISFPIILGNLGGNEKSALSNLRFVRVAFPKYIERKPFYSNAIIQCNGKQYPLEMSQNINDIAFKTLKDRMVRELGKAILRLALKQAMEEVARRQNPNAGMLVSIANAVTEKADTRNWQTLPYSVSYSRVELAEGSNDFNLIVKAPNNTDRSYQFNIVAEKGRTYFKTFHNIESQQVVINR